MTTPHDSWAQVYDLAYQHSFGAFYEDLTELTLEVIAETVPPGPKIVDFGAGTGRMSIPLAEAGYRVTAVEPSANMLEELRRKDLEGQIETFHGSMRDYRAEEPCDLATCVFTVLLYLLDEEELEASLAAAASAVRPGGLLLIDIPHRSIFHGSETTAGPVQRIVEISRHGETDLYHYSEHLVIDQGGDEKTYSDAFDIRYWEADPVLQLMAKNGFELEADLQETFAGSGSRYFLMRHR